MHTAHIILVKADDHEEAVGKVRSNIDNTEASFADWSDWSVIGDEGIGDSRYSFADFIEGWEGNTHAVGLKDETDLFYQVLNTFKTYRDAEFNSLKESLKDFDLTSFLEIEMDGYYPDVYNLLKLARLANGEYSYESKIFDLEHWCITTKYFDEEVTKGENDWFAVLVDFHF